MFARVTMNFGHEMRVVVPDRAVVKLDGLGQTVMSSFIHPETQTVSYNKVELGQRLDNAYEVISGVPTTRRCHHRSDEIKLTAESTIKNNK